MNPSPSKNLISRRNFIKRSLWFSGITLLTGTTTYSTLVEPQWIEVEKLTLSFPNLPTSFHGIKIVQFSDLHFSDSLGIPEVKKICEMIQSLQPDLLCFTGDLIDQSFTDSQSKEIAIYLKKLKAPLGKFAILGNHDYWGDIHLVKGCWKNSGFQLLLNETSIIHHQNEQIYVSGTDDALAGSYHLDTISKVPDHAFHIVLAHEPDLCEDIAKYSVDLQLSGHSHGGQICLPLFGPIITPPMGGKYPIGLYSKVNQSRLHLYTNRGLGTTILPIRLGSRPEITLIELKKK